MEELPRRLSFSFQHTGVLVRVEKKEVLSKILGVLRFKKVMRFNLYVILILLLFITTPCPSDNSQRDRLTQIHVPDPITGIVPTIHAPDDLKADYGDDDEIVTNWFHSSYHLTPLSLFGKVPRKTFNYPFSPLPLLSYHLTFSPYYF